MATVTEPPSASSSQPPRQRHERPCHRRRRHRRCRVTRRRAAALEVTESRVSEVGEFEVRRALPHRTRRMVGAWCFVDHMGPATVRGLGDAAAAPATQAGEGGWTATVL